MTSLSCLRLQFARDVTFEFADTDPPYSTAFPGLGKTGYTWDLMQKSDIVVEERDSETGRTSTPSTVLQLPSLKVLAR